MEAYHIGFKFRIYPNHSQQNRINRTLGCCRFVFNHFLAIRRDEWTANHKSINYFQTSALLTDLKKNEDFSWLKEADGTALQEALRNLDTAYQNFFQRRAKYPRFKSKHNHSQSYRTRRIHIVNGKIKLPKIGEVKAKVSRTFEGRILNATVSRAASGKYYVSLCVILNKEALLRSNAAGEIGLKVGLKKFCTDSNGNAVANPRVLKRFTRKLVREQRRLSRKMPKSNNRSKARVRVACVHEHIANIRKDFLHKLSTRLVNENQVIAIENLQIKNMMKNHYFAKAIADVSWSEFFRQLAYKAELHGTRLLKVEPFYPSSQTCSNCGYRNEATKNLNIRSWTCPKCGAEHDRDENAAKNILRKALEQAV